MGIDSISASSVPDSEFGKSGRAVFSARFDSGRRDGCRSSSSSVGGQPGLLLFSSAPARIGGTHGFDFDQFRYTDVHRGAAACTGALARMRATRFAAIPDRKSHQPASARPDHQCESSPSGWLRCRVEAWREVVDLELFTCTKNEDPWHNFPARLPLHTDRVLFNGSDGIEDEVFHVSSAPSVCIRHGPLGWMGSAGAWPHRGRPCQGKEKLCPSGPRSGSSISRFPGRDRFRGGVGGLRQSAQSCTTAAAGNIVTQPTIGPT